MRDRTLGGLGKEMRVALVHDWLTGMRGGEKCLQVFVEMFPDAEIFTLLHLPGTIAPSIEARPIHTSFVNRLPFLRTHYRYYLPFFARAIERFDLSGFDLVISTSHCVAKGVRPEVGTPNLCYCLTPMRYIWDHYSAYFGPGRAPSVVRWGMARWVKRLRVWDVRSSSRVDRFVAISHYIRKKIEQLYDRTASVVYPPVDLERFQSPPTLREDFYLIVSALVPYKRIDIAVEAFARTGRKLIIVGDGPEYRRLRELATANVEFTGWIDDRAVAALYGRCRGFLFPGEEDFGITAVEAQAAGTPVIAYARGGCLETVVGADVQLRPHVDGATGVFFHEQSPRDLNAAIARFELLDFDPEALRQNATRFSTQRFKAAFSAQIESLLQDTAR